MPITVIEYMKKSVKLLDQNKNKINILFNNLKNMTDNIKD